MITITREERVTEPAFTSKSNTIFQLMFKVSHGKNEAIKERRGRVLWKTNSGQLELQVSFAIVRCMLMYRTDSRGTQNTRASSADIIFSNTM